MIIPFGEWLPDLGNFNNPGALQAKNVVPAANGGYRGFPGPVVLSDALTARCQGAFSTLRSSNNASYTYAGDATKLYQLTGGATWSDSTRTSGGAYACASDDFWEFVRFGDRVIATNIVDDVQALTIGGANFAALFTSTLKPKARRIGATDNFLIVGDVDEGGTRFPYRIRWSGINDPLDMDAAADTQSDFQDLSDGEQVMKIIGFGRDAVIFQRRGIHLFRYEGAPTVHRIDEPEENRGLIAGQAAVAFGNHVFFLSDDGFYRFDGIQSVPIGREKVDQFFYDDVSATHLVRTSAALDPTRGLIAWAYVTASGGQNIPDRILIYSWVTNRWALLHVNTQFIYRDVSSGYTLEELDNVSSTLEGLPFSLDSRVWSGGNVLIFSGFDSDNKTVSFNGDELDATIDTTETNLVGNGRMAFFDGVRPLVDAPSGTVTVQAGARDTLQESEVFGGSTSLNALGEADIRSSARYHRFRVNNTGGVVMMHGVELEPIDHGRQ